jgi:hypothetical protein
MRSKELKSRAYDILRQMEALQVELRQVNEAIAKAEEEEAKGE